ncbi:GTP cyclohydrolase I FolE2 [Deferribacter autotrophicus]|uniref:GTP cyclohydrolase FolE2 n=1 Tax=Deferribacter autotrophicus TaxID=500465 RepID=A0A5A8F8U6_9BACT|nr:GTP cyclohydrolase FolE2 [Deferribacter autotrophicus]KAA0259062.1 GTP cyclohydrolase I FolE2 [Deferribacter autotrophicus]
MLKDIQSQFDDRNLAIDKVGIKGIKYPIILRDKRKGSQHTIATINMFVKLPHNFKGTHMSRFVEILNKYRENISISSFKEILEEMRIRLNSEEAHFDMEFTYFLEKEAPVSKQTSLMDYLCRFSGNVSDEKMDFILSVTVPVISVCPCSKEISAYGAHNQRSYVTISVRYNRMVWIEDLIEIAEKSGSSPIFSLLKREDEKFITECSYDNPVFVEDIVRNAAQYLLEDDRIDWFEVSSENFESIHNHSAFASITIDKKKK